MHAVYSPQRVGVVKKKGGGSPPTGDLVFSTDFGDGRKVCEKKFCWYLLHYLYKLVILSRCKHSKTYTFTACNPSRVVKICILSLQNLYDLHRTISGMQLKL